MLYAWESRGLDMSPKTILNDFETERSISDDSRDYMRKLVSDVAENRENIDRELEHSLTNWRLERLSVIDRNILRLGVAELTFVDDVPAKVTIREMIHLAERYGTPESPRFVNGVLDAAMRTLESGGAAGRA